MEKNEEMARNSKSLSSLQVNIFSSFRGSDVSYFEMADCHAKFDDAFGSTANA